MLIKRLVVVTLLLLTMTGMGTSAAQAAGMCVHPTGAGKCFSSIQAAVNAAKDGDRISIRAGKYVEQVTIINKDVTLIGQPGVIIEAPDAMRDTLSAVAGVEGRPIILVAGGDVALRNLTVDGANSAEANPFLDGITFVNAGGAIRGNIVRNVGFGEPRLPILNGQPSYQGNGIVVANQMATPRAIVIAENRVVNFNSVGITVFAETDPQNPAESTLTVQITDNTVIARGTNDVIDQWGIFLGGYNFAEPQFSVTGTIRGNEIRDALTTAPHPLPGIGIVTLFTHDVRVGNNAVENVNVAMAANLAFAARITSNQMLGGQEPGTTGLILSGSDTSVSENEFKSFDVGALLMVDDPSLGSAVNTSLDENQFEHVGTDIMTGAVSPSAFAASTQKAVPAAPKFGPR
jgi:hypothetical protein